MPHLAEIAGGGGGVALLAQRHRAGYGHAAGEAGQLQGTAPPCHYSFRPTPGWPTFTLFCGCVEPEAVAAHSADFVGGVA